MKRFLPFSCVWRRGLTCFSAGLWITLSASGQTLPTAAETADAMTIGWNLGNTLEAIGGETAWGNPAATQRLIDSVKAAGFNTVRLPCAWDDHANQTTGIIDAAWMARVKEVADYCISDGMYAIVNIHWDNGWLENNCITDKKDAVNAKQKTYWTQIANYFKNYDGHLLFAGANEPNVENAAQMAVLKTYHQTFIDAVRATGGNNSSRVLIIQGPSTDIEKTDQLMSSLPSDPVANRLMVEVHYYTPWNFCGMTEDASWGTMFYYWGQGNHSTTDAARNPTWGEESMVDANFQLMKTGFVDKGFPVLLGEFGAVKRTTLSGTALALHTASREYYYEYVADASIRYGIIPVYWDNGADDFAVFNRTTGAVTDRGAVNALMKGAGVNGSTSILPAISSRSGSAGSKLFRNPFTDVFHQAVAGPYLVERIVVYDLSGRSVKILNHSAIRQSMQFGQNLNAGVYIVRLYDNRSVQLHSFRITKTR